MENNKLVKFNSTSLDIIPDEQHEWLISTKQVAEAYWVSQSVIRSHKSSKSKELKNGKHYTVQKMDGLTYWTKKGCVRLWFFIKSKNAEEFRDWAEDYVINGKTRQVALPSAKELAILVIKAEEEKERLMIENKWLKVDAEFKEIVAERWTDMKVWAFAKILNTTTQRLNKWLVKKKYIRKYWNSYIPYNPHIINRLFRVVEHDFWEFTNHETMITWKWRTILEYEWRLDQDWNQTKLI